MPKRPLDPLVEACWILSDSWIVRMHAIVDGRWAPRMSCTYPFGFRGALMFSEGSDSESREMRIECLLQAIQGEH